MYAVLEVMCSGFIGFELFGYLIYYEVYVV